jgi:hypothetical protein
VLQGCRKSHVCIRAARNCGSCCKGAVIKTRDSHAAQSRAVHEDVMHSSGAADFPNP